MWLLERSHKVFFRAALAILAALSPVLLQCHSLDSILTTITEGPAEKDSDILQPHVLLPKAHKFKVTRRMLRVYAIELRGNGGR